MIYYFLARKPRTGAHRTSFPTAPGQGFCRTIVPLTLQRKECFYV